MNIIDTVTVLDDVSLINLYNFPISTVAISDVFYLLKNANINVDMINQTATQKVASTLSFTVEDSVLDKVMELIVEFRKKWPLISSSVSSGNCKIMVYGEQMKYTRGVAAMVFNAVAKSQSEIMLITTSEIDISLLVTSGDSTDAKNEIIKAFS